MSRGPTAARPGDAGALADGNRVAAIERDAPELEALVGELKGALKEVRQRVAPLVSIVKEGKLATEQGVSYLEAKHMLLLSYCSQLGARESGTGLRIAMTWSMVSHRMARPRGSSSPCAPNEIAVAPPAFGRRCRALARG